MDRVLVSATPSVRPPFRDGLGERRRLVDPARYNVLEQLFLKDELAAMPSFEFAVRERVNRLAEFRHEQFARVHSVERAIDRASSTLAVVSERVNGVRLSDLLQCAEQRGLALHVGASLCLSSSSCTGWRFFTKARAKWPTGPSASKGLSSHLTAAS